LGLFDPSSPDFVIDEAHFHTNVNLRAKFAAGALSVVNELYAVTITVALVAFGDVAGY